MMKKQDTGYRVQGVGRIKTARSSVKPQRGFTLLLSVLIASILLALGLAIFNIISKEIILSSSGRESQFAFYAADTGVECALFWDVQKTAFATSSSVPEVFCGSASSTITKIYDAPTDSLISTFQFSLGGDITKPCSNVTVIRESNPLRTTIESLGYNTCVLTNPRRIERAIRVTY